MTVAVSFLRDAEIVGCFLYNWQTLIAGALALVAAWWAGRLVQRQIHQAETFYRDEARRRLNETRVRLPMALASLISYLQEATGNIVNIIERFQAAMEKEGLDIADESLHLSHLIVPVDSLNHLAAFVGSLDDIYEIKHVAEILSIIQIVDARYDNMNEIRLHELYKIYDLLIDISIAKFLIDSMFNFARFVEESEDKSFAKVGVISIEEAWRAIHKTHDGLMFGQRFPDPLFVQARQRIEEFIASGTSPWLERFEAL